MTLSCDKPYQHHSYGNGILISLVTIADVEDISGTKPLFFNEPIDVGVKLTLDISRDFHPELIIAGNFDRDQYTNEIKGWGSGFLVQDMLFRLGYKGNLNPDNSIPESAIRSLKGKQIYRLSYVTGTKDDGKPRYCDWNLIASKEEGAESLFNRFRKSLSKGYPRNYKPEVIEQLTEEVI